MLMRRAFLLSLFGLQLCLLLLHCERSDAEPKAVGSKCRRMSKKKMDLDDADMTADLPCNSNSSSRPYHPKPESIKTTAKITQVVFDKFIRGSKEPLPRVHRKLLRSIRFSNWPFEDHYLMLLIRQMFKDLGLTLKFDIDDLTLSRFIMEIFRNYNQVPFHNFSHCFMVTQMAYALVVLGRLHVNFPGVDLLALMTAAMIHDLDHPGLSNYYHKMAKTELAAEATVTSPLEEHHVEVGMSILAKRKCNILANLNADDSARVMYLIPRLVAATDMAEHARYLADFKALGAQPDFDDPKNRETTLKILLKASDISNEARPFDTADLWVDALFVEFFNEASEEEKLSIPVMKLMDRKTFNKPSNQVFFISSYVMPMAIELVKVFPEMHPFLESLTNTFNMYNEMRQPRRKRQEVKRTIK